MRGGAKAPPHYLYGFILFYNSTMWWRKINELHRRIGGFILSVMLISTGLGLLYVVFSQIIDDGYGPRFAPEDIPPGPVLMEPWPPILEPPPTSLPRLSAADLKTYFFPPDPSDKQFGLITRKLDHRPVSLHGSQAEGAEATLGATSTAPGGSVAAGVAMTCSGKVTPSPG